jgi:hypothetical protein
MVDGRWEMEDVGAEGDEKVLRKFRTGWGNDGVPWIIEKKRVLYPNG